MSIDEIKNFKNWQEKAIKAEKKGWTLYITYKEASGEIYTIPYSRIDYKTDYDWDDAAYDCYDAGNYGLALEYAVESIKLLGGIANYEYLNAEYKQNILRCKQDSPTPENLGIIIFSEIALGELEKALEACNQYCSMFSVCDKIPKGIFDIERTLAYKLNEKTLVIKPASNQGLLPIPGYREMQNIMLEIYEAKEAGNDSLVLEIIQKLNRIWENDPENLRFQAKFGYSKPQEYISIRNLGIDI